MGQEKITFQWPAAWRHGPQRGFWRRADLGWGAGGRVLVPASQRPRRPPSRSGASVSVLGKTAAAFQTETFGSRGIQCRLTKCKQQQLVICNNRI